jgi:CRISPR-associated protein Csm5
VALARACNHFYRSRLDTDLEVLTALGEAQWAGAFKSLITTLKPALDGGSAMLLRVGRHSGAESVTFDRHRWIRIMEGRGKAHWAHEATTIWLAADSDDGRTDLRPFGWLLLERAADLLTIDHLRRWCDAEVNASRSQSSLRASPARTSSTDDLRQPVRPLLRRGANVIYQGETAIIREIDRAEARIEFDGGDTEWVSLDKLTLS